MTQLMIASGHGRQVTPPEKSAWLVVRVGKQYFALPVEEVQGVLRQWQAAEIPLAPSEVVGAMNLRGRIVTLLDTGQYLGQPARDARDWRMGVVVEKHGFLYCLLVDEVGEVMQLPTARVESCPANVNGRLREHVSGVFRLDRTLLILLDITRMFEEDAAA